MSYHIKDDGTPGACSAKDLSSCPKAQSGDEFHGTLAEATAESEKRFSLKYGDTTTSSKDKMADSSSAGRVKQIRELLDDYSKEITPLAAEADSLRTAANKARSAAAAKRTGAAYDAFNERTGYAEKVKALSQRAEDLGYVSISEARAAEVFESRSLGNGGLPLPPKLSAEQVTAYSFGDRRGWIAAVKKQNGGESQYFISQDGGQWVANMVNKSYSPTDLSSRLEIRPDNLKTFFSEAGSSESMAKPSAKLAGKYEIDPGA